MKLVHLILKGSGEDISLSDGEQFNVQHGGYAQHLLTAPEQQPVSSQVRPNHLLANICKEIEVQ